MKVGDKKFMLVVVLVKKDFLYDLCVSIKSMIECISVEILIEIESENVSGVVDNLEMEVIKDDFSIEWFDKEEYYVFDIERIIDDEDDEEVIEEEFEVDLEFFFEDLLWEVDCID